MIFQLVSVIVVSLLRGSILRKYLKDNGYSFRKIQWQSRVLALIQSLIPFYGILVLLVLLLIPDRIMIAQWLKDGSIYKKEYGWIL